jgi:4-alpha-glucanotransferase
MRRGGPIGGAVSGAAAGVATRVAAGGVSAAGVAATAHRVVGGSPSLLAAVGLEDLLGVEHRPNIPATQRPENWTRPLPVLVDELDGPLRAVATLLDRPPAVRT